MKRVVIIGAGGQARETAWILRALNDIQPRFDLLGFVVTDTSKLGPQDSRDFVLGDYSWIDRNLELVDALVNGIGMPEARLRVAEELVERYPRLDWPPLVHPSVVSDFDSCKIGRGVILSAGVVATVNVQFDEFSLANFGCTIGHEARIGRGSVVMPGANISGGVWVQDKVLIGTGAQVLQYKTIGTGARVGAGAVITHDVERGCTVTGIPARAAAQQSSGS